MSDYIVATGIVAWALVAMSLLTIEPMATRFSLFVAAALFVAALRVQDLIPEPDRRHEAYMTACKSVLLSLLLAPFSLAAVLCGLLLDGPGGRIGPAPGYLVARIFQFFCTTKTYERVFNPLIAEYQAEVLKSLWEGQQARANWMKIRYLWVFVKTVIAFNLTEALASLLRGVATPR